MKNRYAAVLWVASLLPSLAIPAVGQQASSATEAAPTWTIDQAVTCSVHDAWELGGKNEAGFFAIVKALAELSAQKRGLVLPDKETVGREFGEYIKDAGEGRSRSVTVRNRGSSSAQVRDRTGCGREPVTSLYISKIRTWARSSLSWHAPCSGGSAPPGRWSETPRHS